MRTDYISDRFWNELGQMRTDCEQCTVKITWYVIDEDMFGSPVLHPCGDPIELEIDWLSDYKDDPDDLDERIVDILDTLECETGRDCIWFFEER